MPNEEDVKARRDLMTTIPHFERDFFREIGRASWECKICILSLFFNMRRERGARRESHYRERKFVRLCKALGCSRARDEGGAMWGFMHRFL